MYYKIVILFKSYIYNYSNKKNSLLYNDDSYFIRYNSYFSYFYISIFNYLQK